MIFSPYISLYLQYTDIYGANIIKRNETGKLSGDYFLTFCIFQKNDARSRLQMTQIHPSLYPSHINVFSRKKSQSIIICRYITDTQCITK